ncbi:MAG: hypothetical protein AVDCRST_MAG73-3297 [uncultured Thermomicrobiales bacterium]|uniref:Uncharacterized protein n=1 Tax=uncultured Thermomicrobiales bacterium TaxID=1645740 RepID=A0A6J4UNN6_9BACT|nr:MAG: hypothetical protein AVDCRST_MAG73-3297 [uncultured Thermomicrobiales bacterium]
MDRTSCDVTTAPRDPSARHRSLLGLVVVLVLIGHDAVMAGDVHAAPRGPRAPHAAPDRPPSALPTASCSRIEYPGHVVGDAAPEPEPGTDQDGAFPSGGEPRVVAAFPIVSVAPPPILPLLGVPAVVAPTVPPSVRRALLQYYRI